MLRPSCTYIREDCYSEYHAPVRQYPTRSVPIVPKESRPPAKEKSGRNDPTAMLLLLFMMYSGLV